MLLLTFPAYIQTDDADVMRAADLHRTCLLALSRSGDLDLLSQAQPAPKGCSTSVVDARVSVFVELKVGQRDLPSDVKIHIVKSFGWLLVSLIASVFWSHIAF